MERTNLVGFESPDHGMQHSSVMKQDEIFLAPIVWINKLEMQQQVILGTSAEKEEMEEGHTEGAMAGRCILYRMSRTSPRLVMCAPSG